MLSVIIATVVVATLITMLAVCKKRAVNSVTVFIPIALFAIFLVVIGACPISGLNIQDYISVTEYNTMAWVAVILTILSFIIMIIKADVSSSWILNIGIILIISGFIFNHFYEQRIMVNNFYIGELVTSQIPVESEEKTKLPFTFGVEEFHVSYYPPKYTEYFEASKTDESLQLQTYDQGAKIQVTKEHTLKLSNGDIIGPEKLQIPGKIFPQWRKQIPLENGYLICGHKMDSDYLASLVLSDDTESNPTTLDKFERRELKVNQPIHYADWTIYLMSYDRENQQFVNLLFKYDPSTIITKIGILLTILGASWLAFRMLMSKKRW